jgi:hypothetical protein
MSVPAQQEGKLMKPGAKRVSTVFIGATACAAAFAPAAAAGTGQHAAPRAGTTGRAHDGMRANTLVHPDTSIKVTEYCSRVPHWLHLNFSGTSGTFCWGFKGTWSFNQGLWPTSYQCGGTNYGALFPNSKAAISFGPGTYYRHFRPELKLRYLSIYSWTGNDTCPATAP